MIMLTVFESVHRINSDFQANNMQTFVEFEDDFEEEEEEEAEELFQNYLFISYFINNLIINSSKYSKSQGLTKKGFAFIEPKPPRHSYY